MLGLVFSAAQIFWDLREERHLIDRTVNQVLLTLRESATQAAYGLDETLASRVVAGLFEYEPVHHAILRDDFGNILAEQQRPRNVSGLHWLSDLMFGDNQVYAVPLTIGETRDLVGHLIVDIDTRLIAANFLKRSGLILASGVARNALLGLALIAFFYFALTKPLLHLVRSLRAVDPAHPGIRKITVNPAHLHDELGLLARSANGLLDEIGDNLTRLRQTEQQVLERENRLRGIMQHVADGILTVDSGFVIRDCNPATLELLRLPGTTRLEGRNFRDFVVESSRGTLKNALADLIGNIPGGPILDRSVNLVIQCADHTNIQAAAALRPIKDHDETLYIIVLHDITAQKRYEERLVYMAHHDPLTDLPNRSMLEQSLKTALDADPRKGMAGSKVTAILFIDLDRFKLINDSLGHDVGDLLLKAVAARLRGVIRRSDTIGRLGGDEFLIVIPELRETQDAAVLSQSVLDCLAPAFEINGRHLFISPSIGIALSPADGDNFPTLMRNADAAMYSAKSRGGNTYHFFTRKMSESSLARLSMENNLRDAIDREQFDLHYQPKIDLVTGKISGFEALLRWNQPGHGFISPMQFIPVAEETGLIDRLGAWVLRRVCLQIIEWDRAGLPPIVIAVNLSARQLIEGRITETIARILDETGVPASRLVLEITETFMMQGMVRAAALLGDLRRLGLQIAIDDFGTGYSSLNYLKRLPINAIKIDRSFIRDVTSDPDDAAITNTIIMMGRNLGLRVIAEGVETTAQLDLLRHQGCDEVQGFLFSEPRPAIEIPAMMEQLVLLEKTGI
ncbi:bifunctional diguanylate cyclase/phosphodiesterase [Thalassospira sp.]|uniref:putative bifunctional diguanylate cyclase/phosphodiesterase n=1 Tax=Thalassospira sp. TaxID=1912094 RepID=UPI002736BE64|nr:EAL domain-containing protein [Thalassospira sp.]MDP2697315.1 EAL domain-containing protein [Thalassospira sp.]